MKDEIKEILNDLKNKDNYIEDYGFRYKRIALDDVWYLLDYITNLEQENKRLVKIKKYAEDVGNKRNELYERIDKAVDYIKSINERAYKDDYGTCFSTYDLLNILQGVGKDE